MASLEIKLIKFLLDYNIKIGQKLLDLRTFYEADIYAEENEKMDYRYMPEGIKKYLIHDQAVIDSRMDECLKCEHLFKPTKSCKKCGCFMRVKTKFKTAKCPIGKWGRVEEKRVAPVI